jgi:glycosyltransferase involved in cell wall biosynthesis
MKELNLDETNVYLQSRVPTYEVPRLILSAKIGLIPLPNTKKMSRNIPTKLFEYWYCGVPVVASDLPPIAQYVEKAEGAYLVKPDDVEAWADKIIALLDAPQEAGAMAEKGRALVVNECNWDTEKRKLKALYDTLNS